MNISDWVWETEMLEFICLNHCYFKRMSNMRDQRHWHCDLDCQLKLIANLLYSFDSAVILSIRSFYPARFTWIRKVFFDHACMLKLFWLRFSSQQSRKMLFRSSFRLADVNSMTPQEPIMILAVKCFQLLLYISFCYWNVHLTAVYMTVTPPLGS